jgi:hypothetical protein
MHAPSSLAVHEKFASVPPNIGKNSSKIRRTMRAWWVIPDLLSLSVLFVANALR